MTTVKKQDQMRLLIIVLVSLNVLLWAYVAFFKRDALWLETLKVGWAENMKIAEQLYQLPDFKLQNKQQFEKGLQMFQGTVQADTTVQQPTAEVTTWVTQ